MSLILDALKKSEQQRQREKAPGLQSIHQPIAPRAVKPARFGWILALIVICNLVLAGFWFWRQQSFAVQPAIAAAPVVAKPAETPATPTQKPERGDVSIAPTAEFTQISPQQSAAQPKQTAIEQRIEEVNELPDDVRNNLPAMTFSFHVYSENPQQRTIIINNRRMREGDEVSAGLHLQQITEDGVVLLFSQHRIHISVLSGW